MRSGLRGLEAFNTSGWEYTLPGGHPLICGVAYNVADNAPGTTVNKPLLGILGSSGGNLQGGVTFAGGGSGYSDTPNQVYLSKANGCSWRR